MLAATRHVDGFQKLVTQSTSTFLTSRGWVGDIGEYDCEMFAAEHRASVMLEVDGVASREK